LLESALQLLCIKARNCVSLAHERKAMAAPITTDKAADIDPHGPASASTTTGPVAAHAAMQADITIYSHSPILYWWPVWVAGFILALLTWLDGGHMVYLPPGTTVDATGATVPPGTVLAQPHERMAHTPYLGTIFFLTLVVCFVSSNVQLRGLWEVITILVIALAVAIMSLYGLWQSLFDWFNLLHIHINMAGYVFIAAWFFAIWASSVFIFDHRTFMIFSSGQLRVRDHIGQAEKVFDVTNMTFQLQPNVFFRHRILGFYGAGDLIVSTGGPHSEVLEWPNVLFVRSRIKQIQELLKSREVV
jgi:hypothetical protein